MNEEFVEPTSAGRRKAWTFIVVSVIVAGVWCAWGQKQFFAYVQLLPICEQLPWWRGVMISFVAIPGLTCLWAARYAYRLLRYNQDPPPGSWLLRRTLIKRGPKVRAKGIAASVMVLFSFILTIKGCLSLHEFPFFDVANKVPQCVSNPAPQPAV